MINRLLFICTIAILPSITGCTFNGTSGFNSQIESIIIPEPEPSSFRSQLAVARYNQILSQATLTDDERAELLFTRGTHYDILGLAGLAQYDFGRAKELKPDLAEAYNSIGIHYTQQMEFIEAYESFDSALEINPALDFALLNRGIALYYGKRSELAVRDLTEFYEKDPSDPYRALWLYLALTDTDKIAAQQSLKQNRARLDDGNWAVQIVDFYLGSMSRDKLLNSFIKGVKNTQELNRRMCEVYFYLGKYYANKGDRGYAINYFKLALGTNIYDYVEHRYSRLEISLLRKQAKDDV